MFDSTRNVTCLVLVLLFAGWTTAAFAQDGETVPHAFEAGDVISASEMNANFSALLDRIRALEGDAPTPGAGHVSVSPYAFHSGTRTYQGDSGGACIVPQPGDAESGIGSLQAPVQLPHGAEVLAVSFVYRDDHSSGDLTMRLWQHDGFDGSGQTIVEESTSATNGVVRETLTLTGVTVDNDTYSYGIQAYSSNWNCDTLRIRQVEVEYRLP